MVKHLRTYVLFLQSLFILPFAQAQENQWDWTPKESLTAEQRVQLSRFCHGAYISTWQAPNTKKTTLSADSIRRDKQGVIYLDGAAEIIQPKSTLSAEYIEGIPNQYYQANGNVTFRGENQLIRSSSGYLSNENNGLTQFKNSQFLSHNTGARIQAESLTRDQAGVIFVDEGFFTTCEPNNESWKLYGSSIELNPNSGFGTAKHVVVKIADTPIFYFPWLRFPIDNRRQSGFLFPSTSYSNDDGITLSTPFYWNIATNIDATITPNYVQKKGEGLDIELRHLTPFGETRYEQSIFEDNDEGTQTLLKLKTDQTLNDTLGVGTVVESNPTENKYPEENTTSIGEKDHYERSFYIDVNKGNFLNRVDYLTYQTPDNSEDQPFQWRPRLSSSYRSTLSFLDYQLDAQYTNFYDPDEDDFDGERLAVNQDMQFNYSRSWGHFSTGMLAQYRRYQIHDYTNDNDENDAFGSLTTYIDSSLVFEGLLIDKNGAWRQTLTPRISFLNSPYVDQDSIENFDTSEPILTYSQAFSHTRFEGNDRIGDTQQISMGIESRLFNENNNEIWAFKAGRIFYLKDRYVDISGNTDQDTAVDDTEQSDILTSLEYFGDRYTLTGNLNINTNDYSSDLVQLVAQFEPREDIEISFSYLSSINNTDTDDDAEQASISSIFPLSSNWSMYTQYTYNFLDDEATQQVIGVGYENCCTKVSLSYQDWVDDDESDRGLFLQFTLRSLSTTASSSSDESSIADNYWNQEKVGY